MNKVYLINYAVEGIKNIEDWVEFSFYKKTITKPKITRNVGL